MNTEKTVFLGINQDGDLVSLELDFDDLNKGTNCYDPSYSMSPHGYTDIKDDETGEQEARETLRDSDYWEGLGYLPLKQSTNSYNPLLNHIDFKEVADEVIDTDGWQMIHGEYCEIGIFEDKWYYINLNWIGRDHKKLFDKKDYKKLYINEADFKFLKDNPKIKENEEKKVYEIKAIFSKIQDTKQIIADMLEEQKDK